MRTLRITRQTPTHRLLKRIIEVVPFLLPRENWSFDSGKNNGGVCRNDMRIQQGGSTFSHSIRFAVAERCNLLPALFVDFITAAFYIGMVH